MIIQFPLFIQPYMQQPLILCEIETVPVPIVDQNKQTNLYTYLHMDRPYIALNLLILYTYCDHIPSVFGHYIEFKVATYLG